MRPGRRAELEAAYRRAHYIVELPRGELAVAIDRLDPVADRRLVDEAGCRGRWAILTACNPRSELASVEDNARWTAQLQEAIDAAGLRALPAVACDPAGEWPEERGFLLLDPDPAWVREQGNRFGQNAVVSGAPGVPPGLQWLGAG